MGTRADFYVGRGEQAEWLGSIAWDGFPDCIPTTILHSGTEAEYKANVKLFLSEREDATIDAWPWPWSNSQTTDYSYAFDSGKVWASSFGHQWFDPLQPEPEAEEDGNKVPFPNMDTSKCLRAGSKGSGCMLITAKKETL